MSKQINFNGKIKFHNHYRNVYDNSPVSLFTFKFNFNFKGTYYPVLAIAEIDKTLNLTYEDFINDYIRDMDENYEHFFFDEDFKELKEEKHIEDSGLSRYLTDIEVLLVKEL